MYKKIVGILIVSLLILAGLLPNIYGKIIYTNNTNNTDSSMSNTDWWPMFQHDLCHSGYSTSTINDSLSLLWIFSKAYDIGFAAAVVNYKVYISVVTSKNGEFYCLNADTGEKIWQYSTSAEASYCKVYPCVYDGMVYFTEQINKFKSTTIYCLNADTGELIWNLTKNWGHGWSTGYYPIATDGKLFFDFGSTSLYCINANDGKEIWEYNTGVGINSCPAIINGYVYFVSIDGKLHCLDFLTANKKWTFQTLENQYEQTSPTIWNGNIYIGSNDNNIYCINADTGIKKWNYKTNGRNSYPSIAEGKIYVGSNDNNLYCLNAETGQHLWTFSAVGDVYNIVIDDGKVYFCSSGWDENETYAFYCLNMETGKELWRNYDIRGMFPNLVIANEKLYLCDGPTLHCYASIGNNPPEKPTITGEIRGKPNVEYVYSLTSSDINKDKVAYYVDWGDGTNTGWSSYVNSGITEQFTHTWFEKKVYTLKAKAKDTFGAESEWAILEVTTPKSKTINTPLFLQKLFERFPFFEKILNIYYN